NVKVVDHSAASTDPNGAPVAVSGDVVLTGNRLTLSGDDVTGTVTYALDGGQAVTLTNLHSVTFDGAPGNDSLTVNLNPNNPLLPTPIAYHGSGDGANGLVINGSPADPPTLFTRAPAAGAGQVTASPGGPAQITGHQSVLYVNVATLSLNGAASVNGGVAPDTADRATAFAGLNPLERAVQALYLAELGRPGSRAEL